MKRAVIDASVAVKWVVAEDYAAAALRLLSECEEMSAPAHWLAEAGNALWVKCRRNELTGTEVSDRVAVLRDAPVGSVALDLLLPPAMDVSLELGVTVYDGLYLALAARRKLPLVTADRKLFETAATVLGSRSAVWIGDF